MPGITALCSIPTLGNYASPVDSAAFSGSFAMRADTAPGADGPMAAPDGRCNRITYRLAIRERFKNDLAARQQMACLARRLKDAQHHARIPITGPFVEDAHDILQSIHESSTKARRNGR